VCGVVIEEASREGEGHEFKPVGDFLKSTVLAGAYVVRQHCGLTAGGRAPANTNRHHRCHKIAGGRSTRQ
jgi:hypothetical protein